jgi:hypothetical protein
MKPSFMFSVAASLLSIHLFSQSIDVTVHFPKGSEVMEDECLSQLKVWAMENHHKRHEPLLLRGHTDQDAADKYNLDLSKRRNAFVRVILEQAGFDRINEKSHGESWPICNSKDDYCEHQNRRVEVVLFDLPEEKFMLSDVIENPQVRFIDPDVRTTIHGLKGTQIGIPENAFVTKTGIPVSENVRLELKEFYNLKECILNNLTTTSNQQLLESGGMIHLQAFVGIEEVMVAPDVTLEILFASQAKNPEDGMELFSGNLENGKINWIQKSDMKGKRSITIAKSNSEKEYTTRKKKSETEVRDLIIGGRTVRVSFGKDQPTIANYCSAVNERAPLTESERQSILNYVNGPEDRNETTTTSFPFSCNGMGWINCDRFLKEPFIINQIVQTDIIPNAHYLLVFEDINSIMSGTVGTDGKVIFLNVPPGKRATLLCFQEGIGDQHKFGIKQIFISTEVELFETKITPIKEVESQLEVFDRMI